MVVVVVVVGGCSFSRSELLIESEARSAESPEARSAESRSDDAPNARAAQADANLDQGLFIYLFIWMRARHLTMALT